ncbi:hypothetical protein ACIQ7Q_24385 [Streptomyces sp. NPDC096176]|uniref:hypothetical protein n=1 Tax=Streptomyces sp. NPDC096176 TaxID=3366079 RepID=UPI003823EEC3
MAEFSRDAECGFVLVDEKSLDALQNAKVGKRVKLPSGPPWIVVYRTLEDVSVSRWPVRLFRARVVPPETDRERAKLVSAARDVLPDAKYTRALHVDLLEELYSSVLFGPHGDAVARIVSAALALDEESANRLAAVNVPTADDEYSAAWERWLASQPHGMRSSGRDHTGTVNISGVGPLASPIRDGFNLIMRAVEDSAHLRGGAESFAEDEDGDLVMVDPWRSAAHAMLHAAMALGAPHLVDARAAAVLTSAWKTEMR